MTRRKFNVGFQGEPGAFSHEAIDQFFGERARIAPFTTFEDVFRALEAQKIRAAVIPIENSLAGSVHENYDHLLKYDFRIAGETNVRIIHNLIAAPGTKFREIRRAYSHPVALNQCLEFFRSNPAIEKSSYYDTAGSAKMVIQEQRADAAAIASAAAAAIYGGHILKRSIEDDHKNFTRFFLLNSREFTRSRRGNNNVEWKTSIVFSTRNIPGALFRSLSSLALRDLNLTKIESRPLRGKPWEYFFYVDFIGREGDPIVDKALGHLAETADFLRVLGSYPRGA